jgi:sec-independent protein translocase protein TatA
LGGIGGPELLIIFLVVLLVFGPQRIPEVARGLGKGLREIRRLSTELQREVNLVDAREDEPLPHARPSLTPSQDAPPPSAGGTPADGPADTPPEPRTPPDGPVGPTPRQ